MRIRKHAHISPLINGVSAENPQEKLAIRYPYVCQLNQSPWDDFTFPLPPDEDGEQDDPAAAAAQLLPPLPLPPPPPPPPSPPVDGEFWSMVNGSISYSPEPEYSGLSLNFEKLGAREIEFEGNRKLGGRSSLLSKKMIMAPRQHSNNHRRVQQVKKLVKKAVAKNNTRVVRAKKAMTVSSSNPYEFYYYSGFGPSWSRTRRGKPEGEAVNDSLIHIPIRESYESLQNDNNVAAGATTTTTTEVDNLAQMNNYISGFDEEDDDDDEQFVKVKRPRKPVKARSLKSLM